LEATGEAVPERVLVARVGWLTGLTRSLTASVIAERWTEQALDELACGVGPDGRDLPVKGYKALRRLGWGSVAPDGVYVSDRVKCCADEEAARALRLAVHRRAIVQAILATWPADPGKRTAAEWDALRATLPAGVGTAQIRNRTRQIREVAARDGMLPTGLTGAEDPPKSAFQTVLAAADKQLVTVERVAEHDMVLHVQLPLCERPASRRDWAWHALPVRVPPTVPADARVCTPTLRVAAGRVRVDLPFTVIVAFAPASGHTVGLGVDWGVNTLLTGVVGTLEGGRVRTDGRPLTYDATTVSAKLHRLRGHREHLAAKRDHSAALLAGTTPADSRFAHLHDQHAALAVEHERVCARIRHLNHALAWSAARWAVDQAVASGATVLYLEDLATLEARGHRKGNAALSGQVRGAVVDAVRHLAAKVKITVVTVPARGTSKYCPRCDSGTSVLKHTPAPDRLTERGWKWAYCPRCGLSCDRDWAAAERIVSRGLLGQTSTITDRKTGARTIPTAVEGDVARVRRRRTPTRAARRVRRTGTDLHPRPPARQRKKDRPTPKRRQTRKNAQSSSRMPDRRLVPAPTRMVGNRPAGQAPQASGPAAARTGLVRDFHHRTGFHNVKATPVLRLGEYGGGRRGATPSGTPEPPRLR
jgi:hypothetical protein